jgi:hypothetical protein
MYISFSVTSPCGSVHHTGQTSDTASRCLLYYDEGMIGALEKDTPPLRLANVVATRLTRASRRAAIEAFRRRARAASAPMTTAGGPVGTPPLGGGTTRGVGPRVHGILRETRQVALRYCAISPVYLDMFTAEGAL